MTHFFQVQLRTSDVKAARTFYRALLGEGPLNVVELHEQAVARGARPHWLGYLEVDQVEDKAREFITRGASALGPTWVNPEGLEAAVLRDPGGAIVAIAKPSPQTLAHEFGPHVMAYTLNTADVARAKTNYAELFGFEFHAALDLGELGVLHPFSFSAGGEPTGMMIDIAGRSGVHPHWLFHFRVGSLDAALALVEAHGGKALPPIVFPNGARVAVCDDPEGAAFALYERSRG